MGLRFRSARNDDDKCARIFLLALLTAGCDVFGPSQSVDGQWTGSLGKFSFVCMNLQQDGDTITGTASAISDGFLLYRDAPVRGEHPDVGFTVGAANTEACCQHMAGMTFSGKQDSTARMATLSVAAAYRNNTFVLVDRVTIGTPVDRATVGERRKLGGCGGDSGAPVYDLRLGAPFLVGIVSGGSGDCGVDTFATAVRPCREWILDTAQRMGAALGP